MPYVALRSHVVETRLEWHTQPIYLSNEHSVALQFWMIVQVGVYKCQGQDCLHQKLSPSFSSACLCQVSGHVCRGHTVLDLCVGDGAVLLSQMQPELTLVAEVQVAFFTMVGLFSRVNAQVTLQRLQVTEASPTDLTGIRFLPRVNQHMGAKMSNLYKTSSTRLTFVWLLS